MKKTFLFFSHILRYNPRLGTLKHFK